MNLIACSAFKELDNEIKQEFYEDVSAAIKEINACAVTLESGTDSEVIERMFRSLHTVKGNCNMVFLTEFVDATHKLEDLFSDIRSGEIEYNSIYGQFAVAVINVIDSQLRLLMENQSIDGRFLTQIDAIINQIVNTQTNLRLTVTSKATIAVQDGHFNLDLVAVDKENTHAFSFLDATDLEFFEYLRDKQASVEPHYNEFVSICETLAVKLNEMLKNALDEQQIRAVIVFVGLARRVVPSEKFNELNIDQIFFASGLLSRMAGWSVAADISLQLLESFDGSGMPLGLKNDEIMPASQVISLALEFTQLVMDNKNAGYKQSLFSAVKIINAKKDIRYKSRLIERFNTLIKAEYLTCQMW